MYSKDKVVLKFNKVKFLFYPLRNSLCNTIFFFFMFLCLEQRADSNKYFKRIETHLSLHHTDQFVRNMQEVCCVTVKKIKAHRRQEHVKSKLVY